MGYILYAFIVLHHTAGDLLP